MKKCLSWLLVAVLLLSLTACGEKKPNDSTKPTDSTDTPMSDAEAVALCTDKIDLLYQLRDWYMAWPNLMAMPMITPFLKVPSSLP